MKPPRKQAVSLVQLLADAGFYVRDVEATAASWKNLGLLDALSLDELEAAVHEAAASNNGRFPTTDRLLELGLKHKAERDRSRYYHDDPEPERTATAEEVRAAWVAAGVIPPEEQGR